MRRAFRLVQDFVLFVLVVAFAGMLFGWAAFILRTAYMAQFHAQTLVVKKQLRSLGEQGEFLNGHFATVFSALTLGLLVYTTYVQWRRGKEAAARAMFSSGIDAIARYDIASPGCTQALRLLDYYSRLALEYDKPDFYLYLNTVITGSLRDELRKPERPYRFARAARVEISRLQALAGLRLRYGWFKGWWRYWQGRYRQTRP